MKDKIFIDTNVFVYAYLENPKKREDYALILSSALENECSIVYSCFDFRMSHRLKEMNYLIYF